MLMREKFPFLQKTKENNRKISISVKYIAYDSETKNKTKIKQLTEK